MFNVFAVKMDGEIKNRFYIGSYANLGMAKHMANCAEADYAYVKELGTTVFFLRHSEYALPTGHQLQGRRIVPSPEPLPGHTNLQEPTKD